MEAEQGAPAAMINCQDNVLGQVRFRRSLAHQFRSARPSRVGSQVEAQHGNMRCRLDLFFFVLIFDFVEG